MKVACTGHRSIPSSLLSHFGAFMKAEFLDKDVDDLELITGGAIGFDLMVAQWAKDNNIPFSIYLPFPFGIHVSKWYQPDVDKMMNLLPFVREIKMFGQVYDPKKYLERDRAMVDDSDLVVAYWDGRKHGGTYYTVQYALKKGQKVLNVYPG